MPGEPDDAARAPPAPPLLAAGCALGAMIARLHARAALAGGAGSAARARAARALGALALRLRADADAEPRERDACAACAAALHALQCAAAGVEDELAARAPRAPLDRAAPSGRSGAESRAILAHDDAQQRASDADEVACALAGVVSATAPALHLLRIRTDSPGTVGPRV